MTTIAVTALSCVRGLSVVGSMYARGATTNVC